MTTKNQLNIFNSIINSDCDKNELKSHIELYARESAYSIISKQKLIHFATLINTLRWYKDCEHNCK